MLGSARLWRAGDRILRSRTFDFTLRASAERRKLCAPRRLSLIASRSVEKRGRIQKSYREFRNSDTLRDQLR